MSRYMFAFMMILLAALSRLLPHPPNVAPITALALFGGAYLDRKHTFIVPLAAVLISDYFLGFYEGMIWVYASFIAIGFVGLWLRKHRTAANIAGASVFGSVLFFVVTNFGAWATYTDTHPRSLDGVIASYVAAIPFFRNTLLGDACFVALLFGVYAIVRRYVPKLVGQQPALDA